MEFDYDRSAFMSRTSEKYYLSPVKQEEQPKRLSDYCDDPWCLNLTLILINSLVVLTTAGFLIGKEDSIYECSKKLYWTATTFEIYLCVVILRYFLFALIHSCGVCTSTPYQPDKLPGFKKRFTVHLVFSFLDLLILTPFTVKAAGTLNSIEAKFCSKIDENLVWIQISRILFLYSCCILVLALLFCIAGSGLWYFWLTLD